MFKNWNRLDLDLTDKNTNFFFRLTILFASYCRSMIAFKYHFPILFYFIYIFFNIVLIIKSNLKLCSKHTALFDHSKSRYILQYQSRSLAAFKADPCSWIKSKEIINIFMKTLKSKVFYYRSIFAEVGHTFWPVL